MEAGLPEGDEPPLAIGIGVESVLALPPAYVLEEVAVDAHELRVVGRVVEVQARELSPHPLAALARIIVVGLGRAEGDLVVGEEGVDLPQDRSGQFVGEKAQNLRGESGHAGTLATPPSFE